MENILIEGKWVGQLTYDHSYPPEYRNKILAFEIDFRLKDGILSGYCEDDITRELLLNPATIEGTYENEVLHFIKYYPCRITSEGYHQLKADPLQPSFGIQYIGHLRKKLFSKKYYFKGNWDITGSFLDENNHAHYYSVGGKWSMERSL